MVRLEFRHRDPDEAEGTAVRMAEKMGHWLRVGGHTATKVIGPVPCFFSRVGGFYRWQIILNGPNPVKVLRNRDLGKWTVEVDPPSLL